MKLYFLRTVFCAVMLVLSHGSASAGKYSSGEAYAPANFRDLTQTLVMMNALPIEESRFVDEYAKMNYCEIYKEKFHNDFEWSPFRQYLIQKVQGKKDYFRVLYEISGVVYLGRYNFDTQDFPFVKKSELVNVGSLQIFKLASGTPEYFQVRRLCGETQPSMVFPDHYVFELNQPLTFDRLKLPMDEAQKLLERMDRSGNTDRRLYVRFRMKVMSVMPVENLRNSATSIIRMRGEMTAIDLFLDRELTQRFATVEVK